MEIKRKSDDFLVHHGVKGQRWGVRRYQNADGSLTEAGQKRYNKYQEIENKKLDDREATNIKSFNKQVSKVKNNGSEKSKKKLQEIANKYSSEKNLIDTERKALKNYKLSDFEDEKKMARSVERGQAAMTAAILAVNIGKTTGVTNGAIAAGAGYVGARLGISVHNSLNKKDSDSVQAAKTTYRYKYMKNKNDE